MPVTATRRRRRPRSSRRPRAAAGCSSSSPARQRTLARIARVALQQQRLRRREREVEREIARDDRARVGVVGEAQRPVVDAHARRLLARRRRARSPRAPRAGRAAAGRAPDRRSPRARTASCRGANALGLASATPRPIAEERDLHAVVAAVGVAHPPGDVPPLGAKCRDGCRGRAENAAAAPARRRVASSASAPRRASSQRRQRGTAALNVPRRPRDRRSPVLLHRAHDVALIA